MLTKKTNPHKFFSIRCNKKLRYAIFVLLFVLLLPVVMMVVYNLSFIHPLSTLMVKDTITLQHVERKWVNVEDISPYLINAVIMSEDGQFCLHNGVDWGALKTVISRNGGPRRGASTITMQMVKNLFLWNSRSYLRKGLEIPYAIIADTVLTKERIVEIYLNIAEWGPGIYGVEAAAQHFFKRSAKNLTMREAAFLAATLPNPKLRNPARPSANLTRLARLIERRLRQAGSYTQCVR